MTPHETNKIYKLKKRVDNIEEDYASMSQHIIELEDELRFLKRNVDRIGALLST